VIITVRMPIPRSSANRSRMRVLTMSASWITPSTRLPSATTSGVPAAARHLLRRRAHLGRNRAASLAHEPLDGIARALAQQASIEIDTAHARARGKRHEAPA